MESERQQVDALIKGIDEHRNWIGRTTRELRDKVDEVGSAIKGLTGAVDTMSKSNEKLARRMVVLTIVLAAATVIATGAAVVSTYLEFKQSQARPALPAQP